ncbi:MAG: DUF1080 domain-containing protein [Bacteroidales bacterium]|nr:DUF1080 domain-containing protein [Bacteroidales bacterium]
MFLLFFPIILFANAICLSDSLNTLSFELQNDKLLKIRRIYLMFFLGASIILPALSSCLSNKPDKEKQHDWCVLFNSVQDTGLWINPEIGHFPTEGWYVDSSDLVLRPGGRGGNIMTKKTYSNFELQLEFKMTKLVNSGVKYFLNEMFNDSTKKIDWVGFEYQIIDDFNNEEIVDFQGDKGSTGAMYLLVAPGNKELKPIGEWNSLKIIVDNNKVEHWLNGKRVLKTNIGTADFEELIKQTKFKHYDGYGKMSDGHIQLQNHKQEVRFRNIKIRELN